MNAFISEKAEVKELWRNALFLVHNVTDKLIVIFIREQSFSLQNPFKMFISFWVPGYEEYRKIVLKLM